LSKFIKALPDGFETQAIIPHQRNVWARDETVFNDDNTGFVVGFNIFEHTMMNDTGLFAWGICQNGGYNLINHCQNLFVHCWEIPFAHWLSDTTFIIKPCLKNDYSLLAIDFELGSQLIPNTNQLSSQPSDIINTDLNQENWQPYSRLAKQAKC